MCDLGLARALSFPRVSAIERSLLDQRYKRRQDRRKRAEEDKEEQDSEEDYELDCSDSEDSHMDLEGETDEAIMKKRSLSRCSGLMACVVTSLADSPTQTRSHALVPRA